MKKTNILLTILLCLSTATWAQTTGADAIKRMNPYTCELSHQVSADGKSITFSYYLNATATSIDVMVDVDKDGVFENNEVAYTITSPSDKLTRATEMISVTIPFTSFNQQILRGKDYNWALRANRAAYEVATHAYPNNWARMVFYKPCGVAVNNNPENKYFGTIYATESARGENLSNSEAGGSVTGHTKTQGVYIYKSDLEQYKWYNADRSSSSTCFTGAANTNYGTIDWGSSDEDHAPFRVCVGTNGIAYINDNRQPSDIPSGHNNNVIWRAHPNTTLVEQKNSFANVMVKSELQQAPSDKHPRATSMAVVGEGDNQKIYVMNAYMLKTTDGTQFYPHLERYGLPTNDGQNPTFEKAWVMRKNPVESGGSVLSYNSKTYTIANYQTMLVPGVHNDLWIAQRRAANGDVPSLVHVRFSGSNGNTITCDYVIAQGVNDNVLKMSPTDGRPCPYGAIALNTDGTMLAIASDGYINVMDVTYNNKVPILTRNANKSISLGKSKSCNALAFDIANNLYAVSEETHQFYIYAMPGQASTTIPEQKANTIDIPHVVTWHKLPTTSDEALIYPGAQPPAVTRDGYILDGWYYGDETSYSYDPTKRYNPNAPEDGHIWARWVKTTFEEGYVTATVEDGYSLQEVGKTINANRTLVEALLANSSYLPNNSLQVNRKLQGGMYNTFMLPFALTTTLRANIIDSKGQPLAEDAILTMQNVTSHTTNGETLYELVFTSASEVPAYQPFLIKPTNDLTATMTFPNVSAVEALPVQPAAEIEGVRFVPVFEPTMIGGEQSNILILVADNRLAKLNGEGEMLGLRGYFDTGDAFSSASYVMKIVDKNGVVTYIGDVTAPQKGSVATKILHKGQIYILRGDEVYTITGNRVK